MATENLRVSSQINAMAGLMDRVRLTAQHGLDAGGEALRSALTAILRDVDETDDRILAIGQAETDADIESLVR